MEKKDSNKQKLSDVQLLTTILVLAGVGLFFYGKGYKKGFTNGFIKSGIDICKIVTKEGTATFSFDTHPGTVQLMITLLSKDFKI